MKLLHHIACRSIALALVLSPTAAPGDEDPPIALNPAVTADGRAIVEIRLGAWPENVWELG